MFKVILAIILVINVLLAVQIELRLNTVEKNTIVNSEVIDIQNNNIQSIVNILNIILSKHHV